MSIKNERLLAKAKKLLKRGNFNEAQDIYLEILKSLPNNKEAIKGLATSSQTTAKKPSSQQLDEVMHFFSRSQFDRAQLSVQKLIKDFPNDSLLLNISGACYSEKNELSLAINSFEKALAISSDYTEVHYNLGVAYQKNNQLDEAIKQYKTAILLKHAYSTAHNNLGLIYLEKKQIESAIKCFEWAIAYDPEYAEGHNNLGAGYQEFKKYTDAKKQFEKAISLNPNYAQAHHNLGILCEMIGLPDEALNHYLNAVKNNPRFAEAYRNLAKLKKFKTSDPQISLMRSLYFEEGVSKSDKVKLSFALAKAYEDLEHHNDFFKFLNEGNNLRKNELNYSFKESEDFHKSLIQLFSNPLPKVQKSLLNTAKIKPIFITGMPRSGTSLVEQIIASHHSVYGAGELTNLKESVLPILEKFINNKSDSLDEKDLILVRQNYLESLSIFTTSKKIITDKMPLNFRLIGFILTSMPEAKIIHLKRDARATCWSNYKHYFTEGNGFSFNQNDLARFYILYEELMGFWHKLFPNQIYDIKYEKLTINQKKETQNLLKYCELEWDENCLNFHKNNRAVETASASQVRQKMYQGSSEAWKKYESNLKPLIEGLESY
jgi:tetratricopeptide (TPR) repeat protein